jgi:pimeloyl-ACP methyl ester carboxylesterase
MLRSPGHDPRTVALQSSRDAPPRTGEAAAVNDRRPVVLVPSLGRGAADFDALEGSLSAAGHPTLAVEPPSADELAVAPDPTLHGLAAHVDRAITDRFGPDHPPVHLVGHALGNRIARCFAADHPGQVASLTLLAAGGLVRPAPEAWVALAGCFDRTASPEDHLAAVALAFFAPGNDPTVWGDGWLPDVAAGQRAAVAATDRDDWWSATAPRVLVIQGRQDRVAVPENGRRYVAAQLERGVDSRLIELDGAGHALLPERPGEIAEALLAFIEEPQ